MLCRPRPSGAQGATEAQRNLKPIYRKRCNQRCGVPKPAGGRSFIEGQQACCTPGHAGQGRASRAQIRDPVGPQTHVGLPVRRGDLDWLITGICAQVPQIYSRATIGGTGLIAPSLCFQNCWAALVSHAPALVYAPPAVAWHDSCQYPHHNGCDMPWNLAQSGVWARSGKPYEHKLRGPVEAHGREPMGSLLCHGTSLRCMILASEATFVTPADGSASRGCGCPAHVNPPFRPAPWRGPLRTLVGRDLSPWIHLHARMVIELQLVNRSYWPHCRALGSSGVGGRDLLPPTGGESSPPPACGDSACDSNRLLDRNGIGRFRGSPAISSAQPDPDLALESPSSATDMGRGTGRARGAGRRGGLAGEAHGKLHPSLPGFAPARGRRGGLKGPAARNAPHTSSRQTSKPRGVVTRSWPWPPSSPAAASVV